MGREESGRAGLPARTLKIAAPTLAALAVGGGLAVGAGPFDDAALKVADAPAEITLKLDGVTGESKIRKGEIDVESYSWGVSKPPATGGAGTGKAQFQSFKFVKRHDRSSPALWTSVATGKHAKSATVTLETASAKGASAPFMTYKFTDVVLDGYQHAGQGTGGEQVSFNYAKVETVHAPSGAKGTFDVAGSPK